MIPIRLELTNFLPYRSPDAIRFDGIHLACLTGQNGAGKSSLLDAITWVLWGKARVNRDDELIHQGQKEMAVQLHFEQEGTTYIVRRQRARGKRGQSSLVLYVELPDGTREDRTEPSIRATQEKINNILRMDYETFVHSAFLQQGKADAFTTIGPAERKKILSNILGLDSWARYEDVIKERLKLISQNIYHWQKTIEDITLELERRPALEANLTEAAASFEEAVAARETAEEQAKTYANAPGELRTARKNRADFDTRLTDLERDLHDIEARIQRYRGQIEEHQQIIAMAMEIEAGYDALQTARQLERDLSARLLKLRSLDESRAELETQLATARARLETEADGLRKSIAEAAPGAVADTQAELETVQTEVDALEIVETERDALDEKLRLMREERVSLRGNKNVLTAEGQALRDRLERLESAGTDAAVCPLCGQPLSEEHLKELVAQLHDEIADKREQYRENEEKITRVNDEIKEAEEAINAYGLDLKRLSPLTQRLGMLRSQVQAAEQAALQVETWQSRLEAVDAELAAESFASDVREELTKLDAQRSALGYDSETHQDAGEQLNSHERFEQLYHRLQIAREALPATQSDLDGALASQERLQNAREQIYKDIEVLDSEIVRLEEEAREYEAREAEVRKLRARETEARGRMTIAQQELKALDDQEVRKRGLEDQCAAAREEEARYEQLKRAFGKNGIPAMIIETAIPELEVTANQLLARMTDGRMHLRLNTQREKVTGGQAETLDIEIADELGTRSYELYSGGEAFRIDFAIRVALSQMLARRAGAHLRTLFVDEGFGTQDESGRSKLVEAINVIQDEFAMVLVITHIDDLRDSFPVHIVIEKTANGSSVTVQ